MTSGLPRVAACVALLLVGSGLAGSAAWASPPPTPTPAGPRYEIDELHRNVGRVAESSPDGFWGKFKDPVDGKFDAGGWLSSQGGFLPVPIIITEPALGLGGGLVPAFFHAKDPSARDPNGKPVAPSITAVGAFGTENGTWGLVGGHLGVWKNDRIRTTTGGGYFNVNLTYYGIASSITGGRPFSIEGYAFVQDVQVRVADSDFWVGARYTFFTNEVRFERFLDVPDMPPRQFESKTAGLGLGLTYDSRDNIFTPTDGLRAQVIGEYYSPALGGDSVFRKLHIYGLYWTQLTPKLNLGLRLDARFTEGDCPFYSLPYIDLRGIAAFRYLGNEVLVAEMEGRYDLDGRWSAIGFAGVGRAARDFSELGRLSDRLASVDTAWSTGLGFRYLLARKLGLRAGIDVARGPEEWAFYITIGTAWMRM